jgi:MinD-like ATPase involved in chromosome partitioning or flagellar assembly
MNADFFRERLTFMVEWKLHLVAGSSDPESSLHLKVERIWGLISALQENFDYVFIDLGRSLSKFLLPIIQNVNLLTLVLGADLSSVTLTKTLLDYLRNKGVRPDSIFAVLNRAVGLEGLSKPDAEKALGLPIKSAFPYLGGNLALANNQHYPFSVKFPNDTAAIVFKEATQEMIGLARRRHTGSLPKLEVRHDN